MWNRLSDTSECEKYPTTLSSTMRTTSVSACSQRYISVKSLKYRNVTQTCMNTNLIFFSLDHFGYIHILANLFFLTSYTQASVPPQAK